MEIKALTKTRAYRQQRTSDGRTPDFFYVHWHIWLMWLWCNSMLAGDFGVGRKCHKLYVADSNCKLLFTLHCFVWSRVCLLHGLCY